MLFICWEGTTGYKMLQSLSYYLVCFPAVVKVMCHLRWLSQNYISIFFFIYLLFQYSLCYFAAHIIEIKDYYITLSVLYYFLSTSSPDSVIYKIYYILDIMKCTGINTCTCAGTMTSVQNSTQKYHVMSLMSHCSILTCLCILSPCLYTSMVRKLFQWKWKCRICSKIPDNPYYHEGQPCVNLQVFVVVSAWTRPADDFWQHIYCVSKNSLIVKSIFLLSERNRCVNLYKISLIRFSLNGEV